MVMEISGIKSNTRVFLTCVEITFVGNFGPFYIEM